jgi:hypothetical protein
MEPDVSDSEFSSLATRSQSIVPTTTMQHFLDTFLYEEEAVLVDEITSLDQKNKRIEAILDTNRPLPFSARQRVGSHHPPPMSRVRSSSWRRAASDACTPISSMAAAGKRVGRDSAIGFIVPTRGVDGTPIPANKMR